MVKEIDGYTQEQARRETEQKKLENWFTLTSEIFQKSTYKISDSLTSFPPQIDVHFAQPNKLYLETHKLLQETDSEKNREVYSSLVEKCNRFGGHYSAVTLYPLRDTIEAMCPEVYADSRKLALELEKRLKIEVSLKTNYPK